MNKIMEKEWFNGFVANGLQFRLDGYKINLQGITYHICVKNISGSEIEIDNKIYFRFDGKRVLKRNAAGQTYIEGYELAREEVWDYDWLRDMNTQKCIIDGSNKAVLKSGEEYLVIFRWNGLKELRYDESFTARNVNEIMSEHDFSILELKISNFVKLEIRPSFKENNYVWYVAAKDVCQNYGMYVPVTSVPNTEEGKLNFLLSQDSQLEKMYEIKISNCNIHKNDEGSWDVIFELRPDGDGYCRNICITVCVYNRGEKPVLLRSINIRDFENFNIFTIKGLQMLPTEDIGRIFVFPTRLV